MRKPPGIVWGVEDTPPLGVNVLTGLVRQAARALSADAYDAEVDLELPLAGKQAGDEVVEQP